MNIENLNKAKEAILNSPTQVVMSDWFTRGRSRWGSKIGGCGTAGCVAGWITYTAKRKPGETLADFKTRSLPGCYLGHVGDLAREAAELTPEQASRLFFTQNWPRPFGLELARALTPEKYAQVVAARIDHFIETEGRE